MAVVTAMGMLALLQGCGLILDFDPWPPAPVDAGGSWDARVFDAGSDAGVADAFLFDAPTTPSDAWVDAVVDTGLPDADVSDADPGDAGTDAGPPAGCADESVEQPYMDGSGELVMAGCDGALDQCTAEMLCAPGWHLCTPTEYEARGGGTTPSGAYRWLAGCMRRGDCSVTLGAATICGDCIAEVGVPLAVFGNACPGATRLESVECPVGVTASTMPGPYRLDGFPACMHAEVATTNVLLGATCCR